MPQYENETLEAIRQRMLDQIDDSIDKRQGSVTWDLLSPAAAELAQAYIALDDVLSFGFATSDTPSQYIDLRVGELGVYRKPAVKAVGEVTFAGTDGIVIDAGTRVRTEGTTVQYFVTTEAGAIAGGSVTVAAEAEEAGASGNVAQGEITVVLGNVSGVTSVTNSAAFDGGTDTESDESLLGRYYDRVQKPATSGNANHYEQWAKSVAGVGDAKVYPTWNGPGTVKVVLLDEQKTAPPQTIVDDVSDYIESVRPIGATVTYVGATEVAVDVSATLTLSSGTASDAQMEFDGLLTAYLKSLAFVDTTVRYAQIASLLLNVSNVVDYANLTVNGGTANVVVADGEVAVAGTVTFA